MESEILMTASDAAELFVTDLQVELQRQGLHNPFSAEAEKEATEMSQQRVVAIYTRVSTADRQDTKAQESELRVFAEKRGWKIYRVYSDRGESGAKKRRPALDELWWDCKQGRIDIVCVWSLDRLARSVKQLIESLEEFRMLKIDFLSFKQDFDTTSPAGRLLFHVVGAVAEFERDLIRERVIAGMAQAKRDGKHCGRPALRRFSQAEIEQIQTAWRNGHASIRGLAHRHAATEYMIQKALGGRDATT
jgi:DNA invertase Pin-like site-specific DNA recombinase